MLMRVNKQLRYNFMHACLIVYHYRTREAASELNANGEHELIVIERRGSRRLACFKI